MPTLAQYAQQEVDRLALLESKARAELSLAQTDLAALGLANDLALDQLNQADATLATIRKQLGGSEVPANASSGSVALRDALIAQRSASAASHLARLALYAGEDRLGMAKDDLGSIVEGLRRARANLAEFPARDQQIGAWMAAIATGTALAGLPAEASAVQAAARFVDAKTKVGATLPSALRTRVIERMSGLLDDDDESVAHVAELESEVDGLLAATSGAGGAVPAAERALARAETALGDYVAHASAWLAEANTRIDRIGARRTLASAEKLALEGALDAARRGAALTAEHAYDQAASDLAGATRQLDRRIAALYAASSSPAIDTDSQVIALRAQITAANAALTMPGTTAADMQAWQAEVPEFAWDDLLDLQLAARLLAKLAAITPSDLGDEVSAAELALVSAMQAEHDVDLRLEPIDMLLDAASRSLARARKTSEARRRAALRGLR